LFFLTLRGSRRIAFVPGLFAVIFRLHERMSIALFRVIWPVIAGCKVGLVCRAAKPFCPIRGDHLTIKELIDYDPFCGIPHTPGQV